MNAGSGFSASTVRKQVIKTHSEHLYVCLELCLTVISEYRCDSHHLRRRQQQLQHGHQRGQLHQSTARVSGPLQVHLDQQVKQLTPLLCD